MGVCPVIAFVVLALLGVSTDGALAFFAGVCARRRGWLDEPGRARNAAVAVVAAVAAVSVRLTARSLWDGTLAYDEVIVPLTHIVLASAIILGVRWAHARLSPLARVAQSRPLAFLDAASVYVYVSHSWLLFMLDYPLPLVLRLALLAAAVVALGAALWALGSPLTKLLDRTGHWLVLGG